jgi:hypothetical protein
MVSCVDLYNAKFSHPAKLDISVSSSSVPQQQPSQQRAASQPAEPALRQWNQLISQLMQSDPSLSRPEAVSLVARQHPALRQRVVDEANRQLQD